MNYLDAVAKTTHAEYAQYSPYRVKLPERRSGPWRIKQFRTLVDGNYLAHVRKGRSPGVGIFTGLIHDKRDMVMSDVIPEIRDVLPYLPFLCGHVLITGLGLGMVPLMLRLRGSRAAATITIIEKDPDVIRLVAPHLYLGPSSGRLRKIDVIEADAFTWKQDRTFDCAWHDVWDRTAPINKQDYARLRRHYIIPPERQFCWGEARLLKPSANLVTRHRKP